MGTINSVKFKKKFGNFFEVEVLKNKVIVIDLEGQVILFNGLVVENIYNITDVPRLISYIKLDRVSDFAIKFSKIEASL